MLKIATDFDQYLQIHMQESIQLLLKSQKKTKHADTNESTLSVLLHGLSVSTVCSEAPLNHTEIDEKNELISGPNLEEQKTMSEDCDNRSASDMNISNREEVHGPNTKTNEAHENMHRTTKDSLATNSEVSSMPGSLSVHSWEVGSGELNLGESSGLHGAGLLEIQVEYAEGSGAHPLGKCHTILRYKVESLHEEELVRLEENTTVSIMDAKSLQGEISYHDTGKPAEVVYIKACGSILRVTFCKGA